MDGEVHSPAGGISKPNITLEDGGHPQIMTDADQKIVDVNDRFLFLSGYGRGELRGILLTDLLHSEDRDKFAEHWHLLAQTGTSAVAARLRTKSEFTLHARFQSELVKPGEFRTTMIGTAGEHYPAAELGRKNRFALALYEIGRQMTSSFDVEEVLKLVVKNTAWLLESHFVAVALLDSKTSRIEYREKIGDRTDVTSSVAAGKDRGLAGRVIASQAPFIIEKYPEKPPVHPKEFPLVEAESLVSAFGVPITNKERKFGALVVGYRSFRKIAEDDVLDPAAPISLADSRDARVGFDFHQSGLGVGLDEHRLHVRNLDLLLQRRGHRSKSAKRRGGRDGSGQTFQKFPSCLLTHG